MPQRQTQYLLDFAFFRNASDDLRNQYTPDEYQELSLSTSDRLFISIHDTLTIKHTPNGDTFYFIGAVFSFHETCPQQSDGHYVCISKSKTGVVEFFRNSSSPVGIYYFIRSGVFGVVSVLHDSRARLNAKFGFPLSTESLNDFLIHGFISFGFTPYENLLQVPFQQTLLLIENAWKLQSQTARPISLPNEDRDLFELIQDRFALWWRFAPFKSMALSGGIDSRLVASPIITRYLRPDVSLHSRLHPRLNPETDRDVLTARKLAHLLGLSHAIQEAGTAPPSYFLSQSPPARPPVLSGLYGGEFLGGELMNLVNLESTERSLGQLTRFSSIVREKRQSRFSLHDDVPLKLAILSQASLCNVYRGAWFLIGHHHNFTYTPFWDSYLMTLYSERSAQELGNYQLYRKLYRFMPQALRDIPLNSLITNYHEDLLKCHEGEDPKAPGLIQNFDVNRPMIKEVQDFVPANLRQQALTQTNLMTLQNFLIETGFLTI